MIRDAKSFFFFLHVYSYVHVSFGFVSGLNYLSV